MFELFFGKRQVDGGLPSASWNFSDSQIRAVIKAFNIAQNDAQKHLQLMNQSTFLQAHVDFIFYAHCLSDSQKKIIADAFKGKNEHASMLEYSDEEIVDKVLLQVRFLLESFAQSKK